MADYAIGDVQGCFASLEKIMKEVNFSNDKDRMFLLGDVVNRGQGSLDTLRFVRANPDNVSMVLGNHDLHLIATSFNARSQKDRDTFHDILDAPDRADLIDFLLQQPLLMEHNSKLLVHAGIPPMWSKKKALAKSKKISSYLQTEDPSIFINALYNIDQDHYTSDINEAQKCNYIIKALTHMRFCTDSSILEFNNKIIGEQPPGFHPWFTHESRKTTEDEIFFGHWSNLGKVDMENVYSVDTGCIYGRELSAIDMDTKEYTSINCQP